MSKVIPAKKLDLICEELKAIIDQAYTSGISIQDAERLAARTLNIRLELADEIKQVALDSKMKRHGVKAVRADVYMDELTKHDKKPAESFLEHAINLSQEVGVEETAYAEAEAEYYRLVAYLDVFKDAHLYFRQISKGVFEG